MGEVKLINSVMADISVRTVIGLSLLRYIMINLTVKSGLNTIQRTICLNMNKQLLISAYSHKRTDQKFKILPQSHRAHRENSRGCIRANL